MSKKNLLFAVVTVFCNNAEKCSLKRCKKRLFAFYYLNLSMSIEG